MPCVCPPVKLTWSTAVQLIADQSTAVQLTAAQSTEPPYLARDEDIGKVRHSLLLAAAAIQLVPI